MATGEPADLLAPSISKLASSLSHEIRNPLSSVKMAIQTVQRSPGITDRDRRRLTIANREVRTIERMLALLSEYGRESAPHAEAMPISAAIEEAAAMVEPELTERQIKLNIIRETPDVPAVLLDTTRLRAVLAQFLLNIAMAHPEGSTIEVRVGSEKDAVFLRLTDPASILRPEDQDTLFEPFGSRLARGAGLTLAVLQHVVKTHGGLVRAEAGSPTGIIFTIRFSV